MQGQLHLTREWSSVPRRKRSEVTILNTSPIQLEYTTYIRGVDVPHQLSGSYTS